jgi:hypothetical protein
MPPDGGISAYVIWGKNMKSGREKGGKCTRKRKKGERKIKKWDRKGRKWKEKEKRERKG